MKPRINFSKSQIDEDKINKALINYREVIQYYKQRKVDLTTPEGVKTYFRIRGKFWNLERHMRSISEDIYQIYPKTDYPQFFYDYLAVLRSPPPSRSDAQAVRFRQHVLGILHANMQMSEPLSCSQVGQVLRNKLENEFKLSF
jgi:hypothetical protein